MSVKLRLILMYFLQFFVWGGWLITLGSYAGVRLGFTGVQTGSFYATMGIASLFMPAVMGIIADRWVPAQKLYGICHLAGAACLVAASFQTAYVPLYALMLLHVMFYMPTIALSYSVAYNALEREGRDIVASFPPIRVWGTVGFIAAMWIVDLTGFKASPMQFCLSAAAAAALGVYSFSLPACPTNRGAKKSSVAEMLGLKAFALFRERNMAIFFLFAMFLGGALQITNAFGDTFIYSFASVPEYAGTFGVRHSVMLISLSQISETLFILAIPLFMKRYGIKNVMLISMLAWVARFSLFGFGDPGPGVWMLILSMVVYGVAFDFFNISGSMFVEKSVDRGIRASAQGLFMLMTNGIGAIAGSYGAGLIVDRFTEGGVTDWRASWLIFAAYILAVALGFVFAFRYKHRREGTEG